MTQQEENVMKTTNGQNVPTSKQVDTSKKVTDHFCLTVLGVIMMIVALLEFLHNRRSIDAERFHSSASFPIILTILASLVGVMLAIYLFLTG